MVDDVAVGNLLRSGTMVNPYMYPYPWGGITPPWGRQQGGLQGVRFVGGVAEARSCTTPLGTKTLLMDKEKQSFYVKDTDANGVSTVTEYEFREVKPAESEYATKQDLEDLAARIAAQLKERDEPAVQPTGQHAQRIDPASTPTVAG